jgi:lipopolysaccharide/colanic/teichoic acid biosynthesis glycosyltransferase
MYQNYGKRLLDVLLACIGLLCALPILLPFVLILWLVNGSGGVWYCEERPGLNDRLFTIYKLKTMTDERDENGALLPDEQRLTRYGNLIRKLSIDEIPQLINVLKGDMSLVGPRPLRTEYLDLYTPEQSRRHRVRPGITGWAQVNGRNAIRWQDKLAYDVWYVNRSSFLLDLKIMAMTLLRVFRTGDVYTNKDKSSNRFTGDN